MAADLEKQLAAARALELVEDGMDLGLGTGSTAAHFIRFLGEKVKQGLDVRGVPTSEQTHRLAEEAGIPLIDLTMARHLDLTVDGADEADRDLCLIKGGGGALLREKIVAASSEQVVIIADGGKLVRQLGAFPLPVEIVPFGRSLVEDAIRDFGGEPRLRLDDDEPFVTDEGHWILDCAFGTIEDAPDLAAAIDGVPGVVAHGLFIGLADRLILGRGDDIEEVVAEEG